MSFTSFMVRQMFGRGDRKRDAKLTTPGDVRRFDDIAYGTNRKYQMLDVYRPKKEEGALPVIVNVHGGGWVYGNKEVYQFYCMSLAQQGFAVVNFSYRLAPEYKYPSSMEDINSVFTWILENAQMYGFDTEHIFAVGDSAGAHQLALYSCIVTNPDYAESYEFRTPEMLTLTAVALNCGMYDMAHIEVNNKQNRALMKDLLPEKGTQEELEWITPLLHMTTSFPPAYVMTCMGDFLKPQAPLMEKKLQELRIESIYKVYGTEDNKLSHVFHCNIGLAESKTCNREECDFFKEFL